MIKSSKLVLGLAGYARTGKDMVGSTIQSMCTKNSVKIVKLASYLRKILKEEKLIPKGIDIYSEDPAMKKKARPFLVKKAQDMRAKDPDVFVKKLVADIIADTSATVYIITDVRYENEVDYLNKVFPNFEFIVLHRKGARPATEEEEYYTTKLYDVANQYPNGTHLFVPEIAKYIEGSDKLLANTIVSTALIHDVLTFGLPDFSKTKIAITESLYPVKYNDLVTVQELGIDLKYLEKNFL
jgi:hypothetical protein